MVSGKELSESAAAHLISPPAARMTGEPVLARADAWQRAIEQRDRGAAEEILDRDFALVLVQPEPAVMPRARWLEVLADYVVHSHVIDERFVDVAGDVAAVLQRATQSATVLGADRSGVFVTSDVWRRVDGTWRVWRRHSTPLDAPRMPGA